MLQGTTSYFPTEFDVPGVVAQVDGQEIARSGVTYNGAYVIGIDAEHAGEEIDLFTSRGLELSEATTIRLEDTEGSTASEDWPSTSSRPPRARPFPQRPTCSPARESLVRPSR